MASFTFLVAILVTATFVIASDVPFTCITREGTSATGIGAISSVQCLSTETLVSCGVNGWEDIGGTFIENGASDVYCKALSLNAQSGVVAEARCCTFPSGSIDSISTTFSSQGKDVTSFCACDTVLTGCHVRYTSGSYGKVRGSFAGPLTTTPQTDAWIPTDNQCNGGSYAGGEVASQASCLNVASGYGLDCKTKAVLTTKDGFGSCETGYTMIACNTFTDAHTLDAYYIHTDANGVDQCYVEQDAWIEMYANVVCCKLSTQKHSGSSSSDPFNCGCNDNCTIDCDAIDPHKGCSSAIIDARQSSSLNVICSSSKAEYSGGCQMATIYCPEGSDSECNIECNDYFGCYMTTIHSSYSNTIRQNQNVSIKCMDEEGACLKTVLYANTSSNVDISCYGSGILGSKLHAACDNFHIHMDDLTNKFNLLCSDDYSCYFMYLYGENAHSISVYARGDMALSNSYIHAKNAGRLDLFCGSEESEYGCYKLYVYNPIYTSSQPLRTSLTCQGHGCYDEIYLDSEHGALDVNISINGCGECNDIGSCVSNWHFYCDELLFDTFHGDSCDSQNCFCSYAKDQMKANWLNNVEECDIFTFDYECAPNEECVIDCYEQWPNDNGCYDKAINGKNATSLMVLCNSTSSNWYGACESAHIYCPVSSTDDRSLCIVQCNNQDACYDTEISVIDTKHSVLNMTCLNKDSCSHTNVYGVANADISVNCVDTDACDDINVTAHNAENIAIRCEGNQAYEAYASCDGFTIYAENVSDVQLICRGDSSCYRIDIHADYAHNVVIDSIGDYGAYGGHIFAQHADVMTISCKSEYSEYGCYKMAFYIPPTTNLHCEGHGCRYLDLYAANGFADISGDISINGCGECSSIADCVSSWMMFCGDGFTSNNRWRGVSGTCSSRNCNCNDVQFNKLYQTSWLNDAKECNLIHADETCTAGEECVIDCSDVNTKSCDKSVIIGGEASSLEVLCGAHGCIGTEVYCPTSEKSKCNVHCEEYSACSDMMIFGEASVLDLKCIETNSCSNIEIDISDAWLTNVTCDGYGACQSISIHGENASQIHMNCYGSSSDYGYYDYYYYYYDDLNSSTYHSAVCDKTTINAKHAASVHLNCIGNDACYYADINAENAQHAMIYGSGSYSIYGGSVFASNAGHLLLHFAGANKFGAEQVAIYAPANDKTAIHCVGYGCHNLNVHTQNGMHDIQNISFYGCNECMQPEICIQDWNLYCGASGKTFTTSTTYTGEVCEDDDSCDCSQLKAQIEEAFILDIESMEDGGICENANFKVDFTCEEDEECLIDCSSQQCSNTVVYAGKAASLTVDCGTSWSCNYIQVYCPEASGSKCNILCEGFVSCYAATIYGDERNIIYILAAEQYAFEDSTLYAYEAQNVKLNCTARESCYSAQIYASEAQNVNIMCFDDGKNESESQYYDDYYWYYEYWNYSSDSPCYDLNVYASMVKDTVNLTCGGSYACGWLNLYAQHANRVIVTGDNSEYGMQDINIYASNASQFSLVCIGGMRDFGCAEANIYLPLNPKDGTQIKCYGFGCDDLNLYAKDGVSASLAAKTQIEVNSCDVCRLGFNERPHHHCISSWYLYCNSFDEYDVHAKYDGVECLPSQYSTECGCDLFTKNVSGSVVQYSNRSIDICNVLAEWQHPTHKPHEHIVVTQQQHIVVTNGASGSEHQHRMIMIVLAMVVVVVLCVIGNILYCYYKRKMTQKIANEILQHMDDHNPNAMNINYNVGSSAAAAKPVTQQRKYVKFQDGDDDDRAKPMAGITTWSLPE